MRASLVAQRVNNLLAMQETWVQSLGWEDPLEKKMATHSGILAWETPVDRGAWKATVHRVAKSWTRLSDFTFCHKGGVICISEVIDISSGNLDMCVCVCVCMHLVTQSCPTL